MSATLGVEQIVPAARGGRVEEDVEQGDVGRLDGEHGPAGRGERLARRLGPRSAADPGGEALLVETLRVLAIPRVLRGDALDQPLQLQVGAAVIHHHQRSEHRDGPAIALHLSPVRLEHVLALDVIRVGADPQLLGERQHLVLRRPDPLPTELHHVLGVVAHRLAQIATADAIARFQHLHVEPGAGELARRRQAGQARTNDDDIAVMHPPQYRGSTRGEQPAGLGEHLGVAIDIRRCRGR